MNEVDKFRAAALSGSALAGELVIDAHMHIDIFNNFYMPRASLTDLVAGAQRIGVSHMYGSSLIAIRGAATEGNARSLEARKAYPREFSPYLVVKPNYPEEIPGIISLAEHEKIRQFKIHDDGNDLPYDDPGYEPFYEWANGTSAVVLAHTFGRKHLVPLMGVASRFPRISFLLAHSGITEERVYAEAVRQHENIFLETCASLAWYGLIERLVAMAGADRVLFGTDMPFMSPDQQIGRILFSRVSDDEKRKILGLNARRILGNTPATG